jgi:hypothetical protein
LIFSNFGNRNLKFIPGAKPFFRFRGRLKEFSGRCQLIIKIT